MKLRYVFAFVVCWSISVSIHAQSSEPSNTVVFVCEHGAAKSVLAAAYFNKLAVERHLDVRAVPRGVTPQEDLSASTMRGLKKDGVEIGVSKPQALTNYDIEHAALVIAFLPLAQEYSKAGEVETWNAPEVSDDYDKARDTIIRNVEQLLSEFDKRSSAQAHLKGNAHE